MYNRIYNLEKKRPVDWNSAFPHRVERWHAVHGVLVMFAMCLFGYLFPVPWMMLWEGIGMHLKGPERTHPGRTCMYVYTSMYAYIMLIVILI